MRRTCCVVASKQAAAKAKAMSATQNASAASFSTLQANNFSLSGRGIHVDFASTSLNGQPRLTYHDTVQTRNFSGSEIRRTEIPDIGTIVSVTLSIVPDVGSTTFSLLIPTVFVSGIGVLTPVTTRGHDDSPDAVRGPVYRPAGALSGYPDDGYSQPPGILSPPVWFGN
jgi:hypothetical protein